jgi:enoyl-[acyl-carrier protein] reductase / trans-2-enoyl-CoA reductase (NAD+)
VIRIFDTRAYLAASGGDSKGKDAGDGSGLRSASDRMNTHAVDLETFKKLPLGGVDRRAMVGALAREGLRTATDLLDRQRQAMRPAGTRIAPDAAVLVLGGSNGITRALAAHLLFGERARVYAVHFDSEKMQIGPFHVQAMKAAAEAEGLSAHFWNDDATKPQIIQEVLRKLEADGIRAVHLINGIAAGATKRYAEHGPTLVKDLDVAFDPVLQVPDFSRPENVRKVGMVEVEVATEVDIERTNRFMGSSSLLWAEPLANAGLLVPGESVVAFCDYDYPPDDPVYAMGPLAGAKTLQRKTMGEIRDRFGARTARICYPPVATTALGAIPGGLLMYALSAQILKERGAYRPVMDLGLASMEIWTPSWGGSDLHLDGAYKASLPEFYARRDRLTNADLPGAFALLYAGAPG